MIVREKAWEVKTVIFHGSETKTAILEKKAHHSFYIYSLQANMLYTTEKNLNIKIPIRKTCQFLLMLHFLKKLLGQNFLSFWHLPFSNFYTQIYLRVYLKSQILKTYLSSKLCLCFLSILPNIFFSCQIIFFLII